MYKITLNDRQLACMKMALEDYFRTRMGQYFDLATDMAYVDYKEGNNCVERRNNLQSMFESADRNTWAVGKRFIIGNEGHVNGDSVVHGVALHEVDLVNLCQSGQDFVGEEFSKSINEQAFRIEMPGAVSGSQATVRVRMAHTGTAQTTAKVTVNGEEKGVVTLLATKGDECARSGEGKWNFNVTGEYVVVKIKCNVTSSNGYLDWIEVNYRDGRTTVNPDNVKNAEVVGSVSLGRLKQLGDADIVIVSDNEMREESERLGIP